MKLIKAVVRIGLLISFKEGKGHIIGTSGTITSLAGIHLKLPYYQRDKVDGLWLRTSDAIKVSRHMSSLSPAGTGKRAMYR